MPVIDPAPNTSPTVSILTPAFNEARHLGACMASVQAQSFPDFEHIIVDDNSTDDTLIIAKKASDERTRVLKNPRKGKLSAFKHAYRNSKGRFIVLLAGDDQLPPDSLEKRVESMRGIDPLAEAAVARGHLKSFSDDPKFEGLVIPKHNKGYFSGGTIIMSRRFADLAFDLPDDLPNEDSWIRLCAEHLDCIVRPSPGVSLLYRIHSANSSASRGDFETAATGYSKREKVGQAFLKKHHSDISDFSRSRIRAKLNLEEVRENGSLVDVLMTKNVFFSEKLRALMFRYRALYEMRNMFWRWIVGWRS